MGRVGHRVGQEGLKAVESGFFDKVTEVKVFDFGRKATSSEEGKEEREGEEKGSEQRQD